MNYSLGNMLKSGGALNPDGLSLDLAFALDKTLTARRGPTPTFSRASSGTFVNANGIIVGKTAGTTTSITPNSTAISQVTVTVASGSVVGWVIGQAISLIVDTDADDQPDSNELWLLGNIVSSTLTTLTFTVTSRTTQAGSATSWTLGYRGARFDHNPASPSVCRGLLIEEGGRTNLITHSEDMTVANGWAEDTGAGSVTWINNATTSPSGMLDAEKLSEASTSINRRITVKQVSVVSGTSYIISIFAKASERSILQICVAGGFTSVEMNFDLVNGVLGSGTATNAQMTNFGNGWWRCSMTVVATSTITNAGTTFGIVPLSTSARLQTYAGVIGNGIFLWGAQLEAGAFPTSYIPTTTAPLTRSADVCSITGAAFTSFYNQSEGTLFAQSQKLMPASNSFIVCANNSTFAESMDLRYNNATLLQTVTNRQNVDQFSTTRAITSGVVAKQALAYATNNAAYCAQGGTVTSDAPPYTPPTVTRLDIGNTVAGFNLVINGHIARIQYFRKRLPNAKLITLTTP